MLRLISDLTRNSAPNSFRLFCQDCFLLTIVVALAIAHAAAASSVPFLRYQDMGTYRLIAENPSTYFLVAPHHAQRVLPSLAAWALNYLSGLDLDSGFRLLSGLAFTLAHALLYMFLRSLRLSALMAFSTAIMAGLAQWPVAYALRNVWQASDAWTYTLAIAAMLSTHHRNFSALILISLASVFVRQNLFVLDLAAFAYLAITQRSLRPLAGALAIILAFVLNSHLAGGGAREVLAHHLIGNLVRIDGLGGLVLEMNLMLLLMPFTPLLLLIKMQQARDFWWVIAFSAATVLQALLVARAGGVENTHRLIMPAIWVLIPLALLSVREIFSQPLFQMLFAATPLCLIVSRLLWHQTEYQAWHNYRVLPALYLAALTLAALLFRQQTEKPVA